MWTRLQQPGPSSTCVGWSLALWAAAMPGRGAAAGVSEVVSVPGPWLLLTAVLVVGVVAALACALGYLWGRQPAPRAGRPVSTATEADSGVNAPANAPGPPANADARAGATADPTTAAVRREVQPSEAGAPIPAPEAAQQVAPMAPPTDEGLSFSYTISHDLRAPVRVVDGFARILKEDYSRQLDRIGNDHLDRILSAAARMNSMIDAMLSLAQLTSQPLARQPVNLSQLAGYILDDLKRGQPERVVTAQIEPDLLVTGDPTLLRLVLENLLSNAWKYTGRTAAAHIHLLATVHEGQRVFEVRDNGAGFDMRSSDRLFGLFQRLHSANDFPGTGVGLASVQRIVRRHGGDIWAESAPGQGARFCFTIKA